MSGIKWPEIAVQIAGQWIAPLGLSLCLGVIPWAICTMIDEMWFRLNDRIMAVALAASIMISVASFTFLAWNWKPLPDPVLIPRWS